MDNFQAIYLKLHIQGIFFWDIKFESKYLIEDIYKV